MENPLIPRLGPGGGYINIGGKQVFVEAGDFAWLKMWRLLFGEGGAVAGYCTISRLVTVIVCKVLVLPTGSYIDDFASLFCLADALLPRDLWNFVHNVLRVALHHDKWYEGVRPLFLGMQLALSPSGISLRLSPERREKYVQLIDWYGRTA